MAQQINLYSPILLMPQRHFSARAMVQAMALLLLALALLGGFIAERSRTQRSSLLQASRAAEQEQLRLKAELARRPAATPDTASIEQQLAQARAQLNEREALLAELDGSAAQRGHAVLLQHLAQTVPAAVWLTDVRLLPGAIEIAGLTLQPEALRPWLATLAQHPALAGQGLRNVRVERADGRADVRGEAQPAWSFRVLSAGPSGAVATGAMASAATSAPTAPSANAGARP